LGLILLNRENFLARRAVRFQILEQFGRKKAVLLVRTSRGFHGRLGFARRFGNMTSHAGEARMPC
jgi:hypothetical protein